MPKVYHKNLVSTDLHVPKDHGHAGTYLEIAQLEGTYLMQDGSKPSTGQQNFEAGLVVDDNQDLIFGSGGQGRIQWRLGTNDWLEILTGVNQTYATGVVTLIGLGDTGHANREPGLVLNPTFRAYALGTANANHYIEFFHDGTDAYIQSGSGTINFNDDNLITTGSITGASLVGTSLTIDDTLLYVDGTNRLAGFGTDTPVSLFDVITGVISFSEASTSPDTSSHQGYTTDGTYHYTIDTTTIYKRNDDATWSVDSTNADPFNGINGDHLGDADYHDTKLYFPGETYVSCGTYSDQQILVFNASDLTRDSATDISAQGHEAAGLVVVPEDGTNGIIYMVSFCDGSGIFKYDLSDFSYLGTIPLNVTITSIQGITYKDNLFYIAAGSKIYSANKNGGVNDLYTDGTGGTREGVDYSQDELRWLIDNGAGEKKVHFLDATVTDREFIVSPAGKVGAGITVPIADLHVSNSGTPTLYVASSSNAGDAKLRLAETTGSTYYGFEFVYDGGDDKLGLWSKHFSGNDAERMSWLKTGSVGIGATSPGARLHIKKEIDGGSGANELLRLEGADDDASENLAENDGVGISFYVPEDTGSELGAQINVIRENATDTNTASSLVFKTAADGGVISEYMRLTDLGFLGIGVIDPDATLEILDTTVQLKLSYDATNYVDFTVQSDGDITLDSNKAGYNIDLGDGNITTTGILDGDSLTVGATAGGAITDILDEDNMATDSQTALATQQSIKAYVDAAATPPGGSDTELQYNDGGAFGGLSTLIWDDTDFLLGSGATTKLQFRDTGIFLHSNADGELTVFADSKVIVGTAGNIELGDGTQRDMHPHTTLKIDLGSFSKWYNEGWIHQLHVQQDVSDVSDPPTDAELDSAFGTPASLGRGFIATLDDNDANTDVWLVYTSDASWFYLQGTKAT